MDHPTVMIATDGSDAAIEAANRAIALLHPDARVVLVTVVEARHDPMEDAGGFEGPVITEEEADDEFRASVRAGESAMHRTAQAMSAEPDAARIIESAEPVDKALRDIVAEERPDLLVLGSDQSSWFHRFLHGSIDDRLLHHVDCPLLVVGHHASGSSAS